MRDQPTPEQTPERICQRCGVNDATKKWSHEFGWEDVCSGCFVVATAAAELASGSSVGSTSDPEPAHDPAGASSPPQTSIDALTATLAHLTERAQDALKAEDRVRKQVDSLENLRDQLFLAEDRAEQAEATLARVKALVDEMRHSRADAHEWAVDLDAALVDPLVSSSTEQTTKGK